MSTSPRYVTCRCQYCDGGIEFDASQLDKGETRTVECPHCQLETTIFVPRAQPPPPIPPPPPEKPPTPPAPLSSIPTKPTSVQAVREGNINIILGIVGSLVLILGVFSPLIRLPVSPFASAPAETINYFNNGKGDGVIVLILAMISLLLSVTRLHQGLWVTGLACAAVIGSDLMSFQTRFSQAAEEMLANLKDNPFAGLAQSAVERIQMEWGAGLLIAGALLLLTAAALPRSAKPNTN